MLESYRYDLTGNRLAFTDAHGEQAYAYPADSHRLIGVAGQERRYDAMGNLIADDTRGRQFTYNAMGRMAEVKQGASVLRRYAYNAWGEQVSKTDGAEAGATLTLYDEAGHWLGDYDHAGRATQQTIWLDDHPIGLMQAGQTYYLETDHLGTPRVAIDPARDVAVWRWDVKGEAFGSTAPDEDPDQDGVALVLDMRFPGQWYDRVTGLYYNYQRDYDYLVGRYVQSGPIGLAGGINSYAYVTNSPLTNVDPLGLKKWLWVSPVRDWTIHSGARADPDRPGIFTIYAHGGPQSMNAPSILRQYGERLGPEQVADMIRHSHWSGEPVWLKSCNTGKDPEGFKGS